jgi:hypothetical protein
MSPIIIYLMLDFGTSSQALIDCEQKWLSRHLYRAAPHITCCNLLVLILLFNFQILPILLLMIFSLFRKTFVNRTEQLEPPSTKIDRTPAPNAATGIARKAG